MNLAQGLFMAEAEGYLGPHSDAIPSVISAAQRYIRQGESIAAAVSFALIDNGISPSSLTPEEAQRIRRAL